MEKAKVMLTKEEAKRYANVPMLFDSYYKYTFSFNGKADDGAIINASFGGNADDIYGQSVDTKPILLGEDLSKEWSSVYIVKDGVIIYEYVDYY